MKYNIHQFPSPGFLTCQLTEDQMDFLWKRIDVAKTKNHSYNDQLAGNISKSFDMGLNDIDPILKIVFPLCHAYEEQFKKPYQDQVSGPIPSKAVLSLNDWWVNYQYQNEFNPMHSHSGVFSWVIWMKIPTEDESQSSLPIAANSNAKNKVSSFNFTYTNSLGEVVDYKIPMGKAKEGTIAFFPATLKHCVYPFFNCDEPRISVAGNISRYIMPQEKPK
jgi:hypothetical protein